MDKDYLTPQEVAAWFMVSPVTVRSWAERGWLTANVTAGGHRRYRMAEVERFARERGLTVAPQARAVPRILVVDDDVQVAAYLREWLLHGEAPVEVEIAADGFEAGYRVVRFNPDIVLLDLMMSGMDGFETCRRIKQVPATASIRVIAMSGYPSAENESRILAAGAERLFGKPLDERALLACLDLRGPQRGGGVTNP